MPQHLTFDYLIRVGETLPIPLNYSSELGEDTIQSSTWSLPAGMSEAYSDTDDRIATLWLTGTATGASGAVINTLVSVGGKTLKRSQIIRVVAS